MIKALLLYGLCTALLAVLMGSMIYNGMGSGKDTRCRDEM